MRTAFLIGLIIGISACSLPNETATKAAAVVTGDFSDGEILQVVHTLNNGEILQAKTALAASNNADVRRAAQRILDDHMRSNEQIVGMGIRLEESPLSHGLDTQAKDLNEDLAELNGTEFDCTYLKKQVELHELSLETVREQLLPDADNARITTFLTTTASTLELHLKAAQRATASC